MIHQENQEEEIELSFDEHFIWEGRGKGKEYII